MNRSSIINLNIAIYESSYSTIISMYFLCVQRPPEEQKYMVKRSSRILTLDKIYEANSDPLHIN